MSCIYGKGTPYCEAGIGIGTCFCYILRMLAALAVMRVVQSFLSPIVQSFPFFLFFRGASGQKS